MDWCVVYVNRSEGSKLDTQQHVSQVFGGVFHDLWISLQRCEFQNSLFHKCLVDFSMTCGFLQRIGGYKTVCSTGAWWIFPRPVEFTLEDHVQKNVFHRWPVYFSTTCGFSSEKLKDYVD